MPTSVPGSKNRPRRLLVTRQRGFTLLELLVVLAIVAISVGAISLALRDSNATALERDGVRLAALLEMARAESRVTGTAVRWLPGAGDNPAARPAGDDSRPVGFRFVGLTTRQQLPSHWLDGRVSAQVRGPTALVLGPDAILPAQRVVLRLEDRQLEISSDGLGPFVVAGASVDTATTQP